MARRWSLALLATIAMLSAALVGGSAASGRTVGIPLKILVVGDSISVGCETVPLAGWCAEFSSLLSKRGVSHSIYGHVHGGWSCAALQPGFAQSFQSRDPDLVIMNCGTNDVPGSPNDPVMGEKWRMMVEYAHIYGAKVLPVFVQYSNPEINAENGRAWLIGGEGNANDTIYNNMQYYQPYGWFAGIADLQQVPGNWDYLKGGVDGIHPSEYGNKVYAALFYRSLRGYYQWPDTVPVPCGMWGHREIYDAPQYQPCPQLMLLE